MYRNTSDTILYVRVYVIFPKSALTYYALDIYKCCYGILADF